VQVAVVDVLGLDPRKEPVLSDSLQVVELCDVADVLPVSGQESAAIVASQVWFYRGVGTMPCDKEMVFNRGLPRGSR